MILAHASAAAKALMKLTLPLLRYGSKFRNFVKTGRKMGPTYWGHYEGSHSTDDPHNVLIEARKPARLQNEVAGGRGYSNG
jgi:hypothetical protein